MQTKSKMKALTGVLAFSLAAGALAGCSSGKEDNGGNAASAGSPSASAGSSPSADQKVSLSVWAMGDEATPVEDLAKAFEKDHPNFKIDVQAIPWGNAHDKLLTAVASKKGPDIIQMGTTWMPEFVAAKALMDLTPYLDQYPGIAPENYFEGSVNTAKIDGGYYGVPWYVESRALYYRTDALQKVGYNEAPKTWDELKDASKKLHARGQGKYGLQIDVNESTLGFMFARQNGAKLLDDQGMPQFDKPEFTEAIEYLNSFIQDGDSPVDLGLDLTQTFGGDDPMVPMFISGPWMIKTIQDTIPDIKGKWSVALLPSGKAGNLSSLGGSNLSIFQYTKNKDAALQFVSYLGSPEAELSYMKATTSLPAAKAAWDDPSLNNDPIYKVFGEQTQNAEPMPLVKPWEEIAGDYLKSFERIYRSHADVKKEMEQLNKTAADLLSK